jgi:hypothetical protein
MQPSAARIILLARFTISRQAARTVSRSCAGTNRVDATEGPRFRVDCSLMPAQFGQSPPISAFEH